MVPISALSRTNYVPPEYPRSAVRRNVSGSVELEFTVDESGAVTDIEVVRSDPGDTWNWTVSYTLTQADLDAGSLERGRPSGWYRRD